MVKQYLPGEYAFIKKTKQKRAVVAWGTVVSGNRRTNTAQAGSVVTAVGKTMEYILTFWITFLIASPVLNLFSEMQHVRFFLHILSRDCRVSEIHFAAFHTTIISQGNILLEY